MLVNLNFGAVHRRTTVEPSNFDRLLERLYDPIFWTVAAAASRRRLSRSRSMSVRRGTPSSVQVRERLRRLFTFAHERGRLHITFRDLRSALAYTLFGVNDCDRVSERWPPTRNATRPPRIPLLQRPFADCLAIDAPIPGARRLVERSGRPPDRPARQADVAEVANRGSTPIIDSVPPPSSRCLPGSVGAHSQTYDMLRRCEIMRTAAGNAHPESIAAGRSFHAFARRKAYIERPDADTAEMHAVRDLSPASTPSYRGDATGPRTMVRDAYRALPCRPRACATAALRQGYVWPPGRHGA
jgi:hypothetical protein